MVTSSADDINCSGASVSAQLPRTQAQHRDTTPSPLGSASSSASPKAAAPPATRQRLKKRVYVFGALVVGLFLMAVLNEGVGGVVTVAVALVLLQGLWWVLSVLVLNRFPFFRTMCNVLFQMKASDAKPLPKTTHIKFV